MTACTFLFASSFDPASHSIEKTEIYREGRDLPRATWQDFFSPNLVFSPLSHSRDLRMDKVTRKGRGQGPKSYLRILSYLRF